MSGPRKLSVRSYGVGFGDCFLLSFDYGSGDERHVLIDFGSTSLPKNVPDTRMLDVAQDIARRSGNKLAGVVATHRHKDHVSGFARRRDGQGSGDVIRSLSPDFVLQPWTEDPALAPTATGPAPLGLKRDLAERVATLSAIETVAANMLKEAGRARYLTPAAKAEIQFLGDDNISNADAVMNLRSMGKRSIFAHADQAINVAAELPDVEIHVLGPPTVDQSQAVLKQRSNDPDEYWHFDRFWRLQAATSQRNARKGATVAPLFPGHVRASRQADMPIDARWMVYHARRIRSEQMLQVVRMLDKVLNNTSLILLIKVGGKSLLFPGDAQIENWSYALAQPHIQAMLREVDLYKVGHHGSLNATPKSLWSLFGKRSTSSTDKGRLTSMMSTMPGKHGSATRKTEVPRGTLVDELNASSNLFSTEHLAPTKLFHEVTLDLAPRPRRTRIRRPSPQSTE